MGGVVLVVAVLAFLVLGLFTMGRLDGFLSRNQIAMEQEPCGQECALRIGFSNPSVVGAVTTSLDQLCKLHADIQIHLYAGDADAMLKQLAAKEIDMAFLPSPVPEYTVDPWAQICVSLPQGQLRDGDCNLSILPLEDCATVQWVTWRNTVCGDRAHELMTLLEKELPSPDGSAGGKMI